MTEEKALALHGKVLAANENGDPVLITGVEIVDKYIVQDNKHKPVLQLTGTAKAVLVNPQNPAQGATLLEEPQPVMIEFDMDRDNHITLQQLSQALGLKGKDAIEDDAEGNWADRFLADDDDKSSVVPLLRDRGLHVKMSVKKAKDGPEAVKKVLENADKYGESPFFFNPFYVPVRETTNKDALARFKAAKKAKAQAAAAVADIVGDTDDE